MYTASTIKEAIGRSISHNEITRIEVADVMEAYGQIDQYEGVSELDYSRENNGDLDVTGNYQGKEFRITLSK